MTLLGCLLIIIFLIAYEKRKTEKISREASERFWKRESEANLSRRKDISNLDYIAVPFDKIPVVQTNDSELLTVYSKIQKMKDCRFLNLSGYTNTDLKLAYGAANLEELTEYDQNFTVLSRTLQRLGTLLYEANFIAEAETVLTISIECGTDIKAAYTLLANIYAKTNRIAEVKRLITAAEQIRTIIKASTLKELNSILENGYKN